MKIVKVIEILGSSKISFEDAIKNVVKEAAKTVKNIKSVHATEMQVTVVNDEVSEYRVSTKVAFIIESK